VHSETAHKAQHKSPINDYSLRQARRSSPRQARARWRRSRAPPSGRRRRSRRRRRWWWWRRRRLCLRSKTRVEGGVCGGGCGQEEMNHSRTRRGDKSFTNEKLLSKHAAMALVDDTHFSNMPPSPRRRCMRCRCPALSPTWLTVVWSFAHSPAALVTVVIEHCYRGGAQRTLLLTHASTNKDHDSKNSSHAKSDDSKLISLSLGVSAELVASC